MCLCGKRLSLFISIMLHPLRVTFHISCHLSGLSYTDINTMQTDSTCKLLSLSRPQDQRILFQSLPFPPFTEARTQTRMLLKRADILNTALHIVFHQFLQQNHIIQFRDSAFARVEKKRSTFLCSPFPSNIFKSTHHLKPAAETAKVRFSLCFISVDKNFIRLQVSQKYVI